MKYDLPTGLSIGIVTVSAAIWGMKISGGDTSGLILGGVALIVLAASTLIYVPSRRATVLSSPKTILGFFVAWISAYLAIGASIYFLRGDPTPITVEVLPATFMTGVVPWCIYLLTLLLVRSLLKWRPSPKQPNW
jgi:hypothetical protein